MPDSFAAFDRLLAEDGPAAITLTQPLRPVGEEIVFPPTYAAPKDDRSGKPSYNIDRFGSGENARSVCTLDSVPSQINRIEPAFATIAGGKLVPRVVVKAEQKDKQTGEVEEVYVNLLEAGHRAADAIVRFSGLADELRAAFKARLKGDSLPMARIAPTSLLFGAWDSRDTGAKLPRLVNAIIRAYDVDVLKRSAQYGPALHDYTDAGVSPDAVKKLSEHGMAAVPAPGALGGVIARGGIKREASLNLATLRDITTPDADQADKLRKYILGLALVALTYFDGKTLNLRQGCQLVGKPDEPMKRTLISADGTENPFQITREDAIAYATAAAEAFGVDEGRPDEKFDPKLAVKAAKDAAKKKGQDD